VTLCTAGCNILIVQPVAALHRDRSNFAERGGRAAVWKGLWWICKVFSVERLCVDL
jgi:hypothetical protein